MKKIFIVLAMLVISSAFGQGNFTTEWESPAGWIFDSPYGNIFKLNSNSNVYHLSFADSSNEHNVRFYNGSTHALDYSWTWTGTASGFYPIGIQGIDYGDGQHFYTSKFDVNGDGVNEIFQDADNNRIVNPVNGNVLFSTPDWIYYTMDIDGDGFLELILRTQNGRIKIISTQAQYVSIENNNEIIKEYKLKQNYPNPFNPNTTIEYTLNKNSDVKIVIYDILGKEVNTLVNQKQISGTYKINLNGNDLSSGTYFYSLIVDGVAESKKMVVIE